MRQLSMLLILLSLAGCDDSSSDDARADAASDAGRDSAGDDADVGAMTPDSDRPDSNDSGDDSGGTDVTDEDTERDPLSGPPELEPGEDGFMVVVLPDTQIYAQSYPETFDSQLRWVAEHAEEYRIVFVTHVGDIVQTGSVDQEWEVARAAYDWLEDIDMPHGFSIASHDTNPGPTDVPYDSSCSRGGTLDCDAIQFKRRFGADRYEGRSWYGGTSASGLSSYQLVSAGGLDLLFLHLPQDTPRAELEWAGEVLDAHPGTLAQLNTHRYLFDYRLTEWLPAPLNILLSGRFTDLTYTLGSQELIYTDGVPAELLFFRFIREHPNIWAVTCGHVDAEFRQQSLNAAGLPIYEMLADFQDTADGGGGWLRLLVFRPSRNEVEVVTLSTLTGEIRQNGDGFDHSVQILRSYREAYGAELSSFGLDDEVVDALLESVSVPGADRDEYYESLYGSGARDSRFLLPVDFAAYIEASQ